MYARTMVGAVAVAVWTIAVGAAPAWAEGAAAAQGAAALARVESSYVCMMNDKRFAEPQIPVEVEGRTYYGCCAMCKERLTQDAQARTAIDPVSGKPVDKADAVIGAAPNGRVFYFESEANLTTFAARAAQP